MIRRRQHYDNSVLDVDLFGSRGEFMGWSEFDSCVSANEHSSKSCQNADLHIIQAITWPDGLGMLEPGLGL
jgi:hypothetical protein